MMDQLFSDSSFWFDISSGFEGASEGPSNPSGSVSTLYALTSPLPQHRSTFDEVAPAVYSPNSLLSFPPSSSPFRPSSLLDTEENSNFFFLQSHLGLVPSSNPSLYFPPGLTSDQPSSAPYDALPSLAPPPPSSSSSSSPPIPSSPSSSSRQRASSFLSPMSTLPSDFNPEQPVYVVIGQDSSLHERRQYPPNQPHASHYSFGNIDVPQSLLNPSSIRLVQGSDEASHRVGFKSHPGLTGYHQDQPALGVSPSSGSRKRMSLTAPPGHSPSKKAKSFPSPGLFIFRDRFQAIKAVVDSTDYEGFRIFPNPDISYSGNARVFRNAPQDLENALVLNCELQLFDDPHGAPLSPCRDCRAYFELKKYFKVAPEAKDRIFHVRNTKIITIQDSSFEIQARVMCASVHHRNQPFVFNFSLIDNAGNIVMISRMVAYAKQWKRSGEAMSDLSCKFFYPA